MQQKIRSITTISVLIITLLLQGCVSKEDMGIGKRTIYPCMIGCGDKGITPPKGYVYYQNRLMSLAEFNRITNQHIVQQ